VLCFTVVMVFISCIVSVTCQPLCCAPPIWVISMVEDGSNRESIIWLGVDAVITTSLSITLPHSFINTHPIIHLFTHSIAVLDSLGDYSDSTLRTVLALARCRHHYFSNSHLCPDTRHPFSKTSYRPLSWSKHICSPCHRFKN